MTDGPSDLDIAIVGLDCVFPGAPDAATYWHNIVTGFDAITDAPAAQWDPVHYDPESKAPDRFYQRRGGFVDEHARFDPLVYGVMPVAARGAEPDQLLALDLATRALADAGYSVARDRTGRPIPGDRTGVIVGRGNYIGAGMTRLQQRDPSAKAGRRRHPSRRTVEPLSRRFPWLVARFETWTTPARVCPQ